MSSTEEPRENTTPGGSESLSLLRGKTVPRPSESEMIRKSWDNGRSIQVDLLAGMFGVSAWLSINALWTQLPILVDKLPERWNLASYLSVLIQLANVGPLLFSLSRRYFPLPETKLIYFILLQGTASLIFGAFYYDRTWFVLGAPHSGVLFMVTFCIAVIGCTSSVLFIPFMNHYPEVHLISYMVGEGVSGFLPSIISLVQGVGGNPTCVNSTVPGQPAKQYSPPPRFSTGVFFVIIFSVMVLSSVAFVLLNNLPSCKSRKIRKEDEKPANEPETGSTRGESESVTPSSENPSSMSVSLLILQGIVSMLSNGALPSIQSYSCLPYGNVAYHFAVNLGHMANPVACFLAFFLPLTPPAVIFSLFSLAVIPIAYVVTMAFLSPHPLLQESIVGMVLVVVGWVLTSGLVSYVKMAIVAQARRYGRSSLFWYGAATQAGAALGSWCVFFLINYTHVFKSYSPCS